MKICCLLPIVQPENEFKEYYDLMYSDYNMVKRPDTEVVLKDVPTGLPRPDLIGYIGFRFLNDHEILRAMILAEREGYDAIAGACYFDGAIKEASNLLNIPVVGPAESSMNLASMIGDRFAVITSDPEWVFEMERHIIACGMRDFAIPTHPVRSLALSPETFMACLRGDYRPAVDDFRRVAEMCVEDGADVLIAGCGLYSPMLTQSGVVEFKGAPVIDPMLVSLKMAELMVDFSKAGIRLKNASGRFLRPKASQIGEVLQSMMELT